MICGFMVVCVLLTKKRGQHKLWPDDNLLVRFSEHNASGPISVSNGRQTRWTKSYDVQFAPGEGLLIVAELHQPDKPVRPLHREILTGSTDVHRLTLSFTRTYKDEAGTTVGHSAKVQLGQQIFEIPQFTVAANCHLNGEALSWFPAGDLRKLHHPHQKNHNTALATLFSYRLVDKKDDRRSSVPGPGISSAINHRVVLYMIPASRRKHLAGDSVGGLAGLAFNKPQQVRTWNQASQQE
jgi:hypothetical protein